MRRPAGSRTRRSTSPLTSGRPSMRSPSRMMAGRRSPTVAPDPASSRGRSRRDPVPWASARGAAGRVALAVAPGSACGRACAASRSGWRPTGSTPHATSAAPRLNAPSIPTRARDEPRGDRAEAATLGLWQRRGPPGRAVRPCLDHRPDAREPAGDVPGLRGGSWLARNGICRSRCLGCQGSPAGPGRPPGRCTGPQGVPGDVRPPRFVWPAPRGTW
jgi:hypothetical protein